MLMEGHIDGRIVRRTERPSFRDARRHLKTQQNTTTTSTTTTATTKNKTTCTTTTTTTTLLTSGFPIVLLGCPLVEIKECFSNIIQRQYNASSRVRCVNRIREKKNKITMVLLVHL